MFLQLETERNRKQQCCYVGSTRDYCNLFMLAFELTLIVICYTALISSKKAEKAVRDCNPALSVLVVLVSRKVAFPRSFRIAILL